MLLMSSRLLITGSEEMEHPDILPDGRFQVADEDVLVVPVGMADASGPADDLVTEVREVRSIAPEGYGGGLEARQRHVLRG